MGMDVGWSIVWIAVVLIVNGLTSKDDNYDGKNTVLKEASYVEVSLNYN